MNLNPLLVAMVMPILLVARRERHLGIAYGLGGFRLVVEGLIPVSLKRKFNLKLVG